MAGGITHLQRVLLLSTLLMYADCYTTVWWWTTTTTATPPSSARSTSPPAPGPTPAPSTIAPSTPPPGCYSSLCQHGGTCVETGYDTYFCRCAPYYSGPQCTHATCNASSTLSPAETHGCQQAIDGVLNDLGWSAVDQRVGAWFRVELDDFYRVSRLELFDRCPYSRASSNLTLETSDYRTTNVALYCLENEASCQSKFWQNFDLAPTITNYLHIEVAAVCNPDLPTDFRVGFHGVRIYANEVALVDAASLAENATCEASSEYNPVDFICENAVDDDDRPGQSTEWMTTGEGLGAWIQVNLPRTYTVMAVGLLQRCNERDQVSAMQLSFSQGLDQQIYLECSGSQTPINCQGQYWQQFDLAPYVTTSHVRFLVNGICSSNHDNVGFREIRIFRLAANNNYGN